MLKADNAIPTNEDLLRADIASSTKITHEWLWPTVGNFMRPKDVVVTETGGRFRGSTVTVGTANFGILDSRFPQGVIAISQVLWGRYVHFGNLN